MRTAGTTGMDLALSGSGAVNPQEYVGGPQSRERTDAGSNFSWANSPADQTSARAVKQRFRILMQCPRSCFVAFPRTQAPLDVDSLHPSGVRHK
jgi:hypothetical protein